MGKSLIIKGADFSENAVQVVRTQYNGVGVVDLTQYTNTHQVIISSSGSTNLNVSSSTKADSYVIPVIPGETYSVKYCSGSSSFVVLGLDKVELEVSEGKASNGTGLSVTTPGENQTYTGNTPFTIPSGTKAIFICGRNSTHSGFVSGYELTLTRTA